MNTLPVKITPWFQNRLFDLAQSFGILQDWWLPLGYFLNVFVFYVGHQRSAGKVSQLAGCGGEVMKFVSRYWQTMAWGPFVAQFTE